MIVVENVRETPRRSFLFCIIPSTSYILYWLYDCCRKCSGNPPKTVCLISSWFNDCCSRSFGHGNDVTTRSDAGDRPWMDCAGPAAGHHDRPCHYDWPSGASRATGAVTAYHLLRASRLGHSPSEGQSTRTFTAECPKPTVAFVSL